VEQTARIKGTIISRANPALTSRPAENFTAAERILNAGHKIHFDKTYKSNTATSYMARVVKEAIEICLQANSFNRTEGCWASPAWQPIAKLLKQRKEAPKKKQSTHKTPVPRVL